MIWKQLFGSNGKLSKEDFRAAKKNMKQADSDGNGVIDLEEYLDWLKKLGVLWELFESSEWLTHDLAPLTSIYLAPPTRLSLSNA